MEGRPIGYEEDSEIYLMVGHGSQAFVSHGMKLAS